MSQGYMAGFFKFHEHSCHKYWGKGKSDVYDESMYVKHRIQGIHPRNGNNQGLQWIVQWEIKVGKTL